MAGKKIGVQSKQSTLDVKRNIYDFNPSAMDSLTHTSAPFHLALRLMELKIMAHKNIIWL
jgi:hypothetical protein